MPTAFFTLILSLVFSSLSYGQESLFHVRAGGGVTLPSGDFDDLAQMGFSLGAELSYGTTEDIIHPALVATFHSLPVDIPPPFDRVIKTSNWNLVYLMVSPKIQTSINTGARVYVMPIVGFLFGKSPELDIDVLHLRSTKSTRFAYGVGVGFTVPESGSSSNQRLDFGFRFIQSEPEYEGLSVPTGILQFQLAIIFM